LISNKKETLFNNHFIFLLMDADKIAQEIAEKTGQVVKVTLGVVSKEQKNDYAKILLSGFEKGVESFHEMQVSSLRASKKECLDIDDLNKLKKSMLESIQSTREKSEKIIEDLT
jgi:hypothetical protein